MGQVSEISNFLLAEHSDPHDSPASISGTFLHWIDCIFFLQYIFLAILAGWLLLPGFFIHQFQFFFQGASDNSTARSKHDNKRNFRHETVETYNRSLDTAPGPKSGGRSVHHWGSTRSLLFGGFLLAYLEILVTVSGSARGEGCSWTMPAAEASHLDWATDFIRRDAKPHGTRPVAHSEPLSRALFATRVQKRSIQRAYWRACKDGLAWYKGRCYTPDNFPSQLHRPRPGHTPVTSTLTSQLSDHRQYNQKQKSHRNLRIFSWNTGGLSQPKLDELRLWLLLQEVDIAILQETHWQWQGEWEDSEWSYMHSGDSDSKGAGILILVRKQCCPASGIRWHDWVEGRLIHLQLRLHPRPVDVVACYQHCLSSQAGRLADRKGWWTKFDTLLRSLPTRHVLAIAGDFNCALPENRPYVGTGNFKWQGNLHCGAQHGDSDQFIRIIRDHGLNALNSWDHSLGPTFVGSNGCSRIDYCFVRHHMADGLAKQVRYLRQAPFLTDQQDHCPMLFQLRKCWIPASMRMTQSCTFKQRAISRQAYLSNTDTWSAFHQSPAIQLQCFLQESGPHSPDLIPNMHRKLAQSFHDFFPRTSKPVEGVWMKTTSWVATKWKHRSLMHEVRQNMTNGMIHMKHILAFWFHSIRFSKMQKDHGRYAKLVRHQKFQEIISLAQTAADRYNSFQLFQYINKFSPKQPKRRIQLRTRQGHLATAIEEHSMLCQFVADTWKGPPTDFVLSDAIPGTPFTEETLLRAIESIPISKSVAPGFLPGTVWRSHAHTLAPWLFNLLKSWWYSDSPHIPSCWKSGWLCWLPKPGKTPCTPDALRPISLQEPLGKALMGVIGQIGQLDSLVHMVNLPLWAYLPHRSTQDPLLRVAQHCRAARDLMTKGRSTPFTRARGIPTLKVGGAIQLLIDMSRAFDSVDRNLLFRRLTSIGVRPEIVKLLQHWHHDSCYVVQTDCNQSFIPVSRGVRQGCRAAPWLWNGFLTLLLQDLSADIDITWLQAHVNFYADDGQIGALFHTEEELYFVLRCIGQLLFLLQQFGLVINEHKSQILLTLTGTEKKRIRQQITIWKESQELLCVNFADKHFTIPIKQSAKYLGTIISYGNLEDLTTRHRVHLANLAYSRLAKWLLGTQGMKLKNKLQLWHTCVLPIATYGIFSIGVTRTGVNLLYRTFCKMLRKIVGDHSYRTQHSNQYVLQQHGLDDPYVVLWHAAERLKQSATQRLSRLSHDDLVHSLQWDHIDNIQSMLWDLHQDHSSTPVLPTQEDSEALTCYQCQYSATSVTALRQHYAHHHGLHMFRTHFTLPSDHALLGMPQCKHCLTSFKSWRTFTHHLERGCQALLRHPEQFVPVTSEGTMPLLPTRLSNARSDEAMRGQVQLSAADLRHIASQAWGHRLLQIVGSRQLQELYHENAILEYLSQRCCLCAQWVGRSQEMHRHMRLFHSQYWPLVMAKSTQLSNRFAGESPCSFCHGIFQKTHSCNVWTQVSLLII